MPELADIIAIDENKGVKLIDGRKFHELCQENFGAKLDEGIIENIKSATTGKPSRSKILIRLKQLWVPFDARLRLAGIILKSGNIAETAAEQLWRPLGLLACPLGYR